MSKASFPTTETRVLAVASHVVYGYVGNTMATFVMQSLGCEVAALNTVQFSNHLGYGQAKGTRATASEINELYQGLKESFLDDFDMLLSGYLPGASSVEALGTIARDLKHKASTKPGSFFWVLDPVMGDNGRLYVAEDVIPAYKHLIPDADLILPNQFEAETLSGVKITDMDTLKQAITALHDQYRIAHVLITSVSLPTPGNESSLSVVGSTKSSSGGPRLFGVKVPVIDGFFSGTGDMFAALMVVRLREAVGEVKDLRNKAAWLSDDEVQATDLPLARATEKVLASMHEILMKTKERRDKEVEKRNKKSGGWQQMEDDNMRRIIQSKAAEISLVRNREYLESPTMRYKATIV